VAIDSRGFVYVAHRGEQPLLRLWPDGRLCAVIGTNVLKASTLVDAGALVPRSLGKRFWLHGLHVDPWDNVWVTDVARHLVLKFDAEGKLVRTFGHDDEPGLGPSHFNQPTHVCVTRSGNLFVTDGYGNSRVVKFDARGEFVAEWGRRGVEPGEFHTPHVIVQGSSDGLLYVSDRENDRVQVFDENGALQAVWPGLHGIDGLYAGSNGYLYGSTGVDQAIQRFDAHGRIVDVWINSELLRYPHAIAVDSVGDLYVADTGDLWKVDPLTLNAPRRQYRLTPRTAGEHSAIVKLRRSG
jgi:DNA-binding beta-propeller fold protein YncE